MKSSAAIAANANMRLQILLDAELDVSGRIFRFKIYSLLSHILQGSRITPKILKIFLPSPPTVLAATQIVLDAELDIGGRAFRVVGARAVERSVATLISLDRVLETQLRAGSPQLQVTFCVRKAVGRIFRSAHVGRGGWGHLWPFESRSWQ